MFENNPHIFLSEEDVRGHLFSRLLPYFNKLEMAKRGGKTISLHQQISFFGDRRTLSERPDIVIIDVKTLDLKAKTGKCFYFEKSPFGVELKLNKNKGKEKVLKELKEDLIKTEKLHQRNPELNFFIFYLDKKSRLTEDDIMKLQLEYRAKIIYAKPKRQNKEG